MSLFNANHICCNYGKKHIINDISFSIDNGCLVGILGANGSGKTTLLKAICGNIPHSGTCTLNGSCLEKLSPRNLARLCSYIPQRSGISIDISVLDVVLMGFNPYIKLLEHPSADMRKKAIDILSLVGLSNRENDNYMTLSEGQKQLCILARTLISESTFLLLDEPESALDFHFRYQMLDILSEWTHKENHCALITLHDPALALNYCDSLILLHDGTISETLYPRIDSLKKMEEKLSLLYGNVSLHTCPTRDGRSQLVLIRETI